MLTSQTSSYRLLFPIKSIGNVFWLENADRQLLYVSPSYEKIWGRSLTSLYQNPASWLEAIHPHDRACIAAKRLNLPYHLAQDAEYRIVRPDGQVRWINDRAFPIYNTQGEICRIAGFAEDITERKQAEQEIRRSHDLLEAVFQESADAIFLVDPETLANLDCNQRAVELFEANHKSDLIGLQGYKLHKDPFALPQLSLARTDIREKGVWTQEIEYQTLKGNCFWGSIAAKRVEVVGQRKTLVRITDISDRKQAEQLLTQQVQREQLIQAISQQIRSSLQLEEILETSVTQVRQVLQADRALVFRLNLDGSGIVTKESVLPNYPLTAEMLWSDQHFPPQSHQFYLQGQARAVANVETDILSPCLLEFMHQICVKSKLVAPIIQIAETGDLTVWGLLIVHSCDRVRQWEPAEVTLVQQVAVQMGIAIQQADLYFQLETQLRQKEVLLKEVHHRVKNNLQVVSAMLNLQARMTQDPAVRDVLADSRSRLRAIALIHEILYQSDHLERLNFQQYIRRLAGSILSAYSDTQISLIYQMQPVLLNLETAIPCGLLVSELVTNALKHAFPDGQKGKIEIILEAIHDSEIDSVPLQLANLDAASTWMPSPCRYRLVIQDNGIGIATDLDFSKLKSLGLKIVYDLALQLRGTLELDRAFGTRFQLTFSELEYRKRF